MSHFIEYKDYYNVTSDYNYVWAHGVRFSIFNQNRPLHISVRGMHSKSSVEHWNSLSEQM